MAIIAIGATVWASNNVFFSEPNQETVGEFHFNCDSSFNVLLEPKKIFFDTRENLLSGQEDNPFRNEQVAVVLCGEEDKSFPENEFSLCEAKSHDITTMCQGDQVLPPLGMWTKSENGDFVAYFIKSNPDRLCLNCDHESQVPYVDKMNFFDRREKSSIVLDLGESWTPEGGITREK